MTVEESRRDWPGFSAGRVVHCERFGAALRSGDLAAAELMIAELVRTEAAQARAEEREACAAHVREVLKECLTLPLKHLGDVAAAAIRARGNS